MSDTLPTTLHMTREELTKALSLLRTGDLIEAVFEDADENIQTSVVGKVEVDRGARRIIMPRGNRVHLTDQTGWGIPIYGLINVLVFEEGEIPEPSVGSVVRWVTEGSDMAHVALRIYALPGYPSWQVSGIRNPVYWEAITAVGRATLETVTEGESEKTPF